MPSPFTALPRRLSTVVTTLLLVGGGGTALAQMPAPTEAPAPVNADPSADPSTAMPSAAPAASGAVQETCASVSDRAMASDLRSATAQSQKTESAQLTRLVDESIALWTLAVQRCEGRGQERARRNLSDSERSRQSLSAALGISAACTSGQKDASSLQELAQQAVRERRWTDAALLYRKAENMWDVSAERCAGEAQQTALQRRDQTATDAHNAEFCAPVFEKAREQSQHLRRLAGERTSPDKQTHSQAAETLWRNALNQCRGAAQDVARNNADQLARERGSAWVATSVPGAPLLVQAVAPSSNPVTQPAAPTTLASAAAPPAASPAAPPATAPSLLQSLSQALTGTATATATPAPVAAGGAPSVAQSLDVQAGDTRFVGQFVREGSSLSGKGQIQWPNGDNYSGDILKSQRHGQGNFVWASGQRYSGPWVNDQAQGKGQMVFANGDQYDGEVLQGVPNGQGRMRYAIGDVFEGRFARGRPDGQGAYRWANGQQYEGPWLNDQPHGLGKLKFANGNLFEGQLQAGKPEGNGSLSFASGDRYEGHVSQGVPHGEGSYRWTNGDRYQGQWLQGKKHGKGRMHWANGDAWEGRFDNDNRSTDGVLTPKGG